MRFLADSRNYVPVKTAVTAVEGKSTIGANW
jgi:hypothetical protein